MLLSLIVALLPVAATPAPPETVTVTVLATTDTHGFLYPWDYFTRQPAPRGLAAAATLIAQVRRESPRTCCFSTAGTRSRVRPSRASTRRRCGRERPRRPTR